MVLELGPGRNSDELHRDVTSQNAPGPRSLQIETRRKTNMAATQVPVYERQGYVERPFHNPTGVAASNAEVFVAGPTSGHEKITVFNLKLQPVREFPTVVQDNQKMRPEDVALDGKGNLWVVGTTSDARFAMNYTREGNVLTKIELPKSAIDLPRGIAVDTARNHVLVAQTMYPQNSPGSESLPSQSFIGVYREDGTLDQERTVRKMDLEGTRQNQQYLDVTPSGYIVVSNEVKNCISVYNMHGPFAEFGGVGSGAGQLNDPRGICTDGAGNVIVADRGNNRVVLFDNNGKFCRNLVENLTIAPQAVAVTVSHARQVKLVVTSVHDNKVAILDLRT